MAQWSRASEDSFGKRRGARRGRERKRCVSEGAEASTGWAQNGLVRRVVRGWGSAIVAVKGWVVRNTDDLETEELRSRRDEIWGIHARFLMPRFCSVLNVPDLTFHTLIQYLSAS